MSMVREDEHMRAALVNRRVLVLQHLRQRSAVACEHCRPQAHGKIDQRHACIVAQAWHLRSELLHDERYEPLVWLLKQCLDCLAPLPPIRAGQVQCDIVVGGEARVLRHQTR